MTVRDALQQGQRLLDQAAIPVPRLTAEVLLCHVLGRERTYLYSHPEQELTSADWLHYGRYLHQRLSGEPTQYITQRQEFFGREFHVNRDVLIPRPETEHVVERVLELDSKATNSRPLRILDVGCGSGAIAITLSLELKADVWALDISPAALVMTGNNARRLGAKVHLLACDVVSAVVSGSMDIVVSNPPYVAGSEAEGLQREVRDHEPHIALFAGDTGMEIYQRLVADGARVLRPGGWLVLELGFKSEQPVRGMLDSRWQDIRVTADLAGLPRVLSARLRP